MGANIKVSSDAKQFQQEMQKVTQELKVMSSELGLATTKAELFGSEQDKLKAKSNELNNNIKTQNTLLGLQKQAIDTITGDIEKYKDRNNELSKSISDVEAKLKDEIRTNGQDTEEVKKLTSELNKLQNEYNSNGKAIEKNLKQVDTYKIKMADAEKAILNSKKALEETDKKLTTMNWDKASQNLENFGNKTKDIGQNLSTKVSLPIIALYGASEKLASDVTESLNKVDVAFGKNADDVKKWSGTTLNNFGLAKGTALDLASGYGDMATSMGFTTEQASKMSKEIVGRAADLSSFKNISIDIANTALTGIFSGETESLKKLGVVMTQANLQEYAYSKGINKKIQDMSQSEQVQLRYNYVMEKTTNAQGDFARTSDGVANSTRVTKETVKELGAQIGENLLPMVASILKPLNEFLKGLSEMSPTGQKVVITIGLILAIIPPLLVIIGTLISTIGTIIGAVTAAGGVIAVLTSPITLVIVAIVALIAIGVLLWKNWDKIKEMASKLGEYLKEKFNDIKNFFKEWGSIILIPMMPFIGIPLTIKQHWGEITDFFEKLKNSIKQKLHDMFDFQLPKIKLPHFSISGDFSIVPPKIPKVGVEWYADGGIMTQPTLFGFNGSKAMIGGEAGQEGIIPLKQLWKQLSLNFDKLEERLSNKRQQEIVVNTQLNVDGKAVARATARHTNEELSRLNRNSKFALSGGV